MNTTLLTILADRLEAIPNEKFNIAAWQSMSAGQLGFSYVNNEADFHTCGNTACIAGYAVLVKEWQDAGLYLSDTFGGCPTYGYGSDTINGAPAFAKVANMSDSLACALVADVGYLHRTGHIKPNHQSLLDAVNEECGHPYDWEHSMTLQATLCSIVDKAWEDWNQHDAAKLIRHVVALKTSTES